MHSDLLDRLGHCLDSLQLVVRQLGSDNLLKLDDDSQVSPALSLGDDEPESLCIFSSIKPTGAAKGGNAQFRLRIEPSASPTEVWVLLSRHRVSRLDREFIGLNVTEGEAAGTRGATSLDFAVSRSIDAIQNELIQFAGQSRG